MNRFWPALLLVMLLPVQDVSAKGTRMQPSVEEVKAAHERHLLALPGVVSIGIGRDDQNRPVIVLGLDQPRPQTQAEIPRELDGYRVRVNIVGPIRAR